jgi:hypothetical protein
MGEGHADFFEGVHMLSYVFYFLLIFSLVCWVEWPGLWLPNSLIIRKDPATELEGWLKAYNWGHRQELQTVGALPQYKFYGVLIENLLDLARRMGGHYQESFLFLREGLQRDKQFEKKLRETLTGIFFQMGAMMFLTWLFIIGALMLVDVKVKPMSLVLIFSWQCLGLLILPMILRYLRARYFGDIGKLWKIFFILRSLQKVPLSRSEILTAAGVQDLKLIKQKSLEDLVVKLKELCQKVLKLGSSYEEDLKYLMEELRFQEKWHFELFEKRLTVIKLALLSLFFLPSYLAFIFLLLSDLMALM